MNNITRFMLGAVAMVFVSAPAFAKKEKIYITGGGDKTIVIEQKDKIITILPDDGGKFKAPPQFTPPKEFTAPDRFKAPDKFKAPEKFTKPTYNQ